MPYQRHPLYPAAVNRVIQEFTENGVWAGIKRARLIAEAFEEVYLRGAIDA